MAKKNVLTELTAEQKAFADEFAPFIRRAWECIAWDYIASGEDGETSVPLAEAIEAALDANRPSMWCDKEDRGNVREMEEKYYRLDNETSMAIFTYWVEDKLKNLPTCI